MRAEQELRRQLEADGDCVIELCAALVKIPSEDPPGDTREIANYIHNYFMENGVESEIVAPHPEKPSVVATVKGSLPGRHVVFNGHIDTFKAGDHAAWQHNPFGGNRVNGRLYGRGAADMKGGLACCIQSIVVLNRIKELLPGMVSVTCVSDEEVFGPWGTQYILENRHELVGDALINGEPSSIKNVRIGEKGQFWYRFICRSAGGHAAYSSLMSSAILQMIDMLEDLSHLPAELSDLPDEMRSIMAKARQNYDSLLCRGATDAAMRASMNIGLIQGGLSVNMIPEHCVAEVDFRLPPGIDHDLLRSWIAEVAARHQPCEYSEIIAHDAYPTSPLHPFVLLAKNTAEEIVGEEVYITFSLGGTEARFWRNKGVPAITYGPNHHNMGSPDEYIEEEELKKVLQVHTLTALRFLISESRTSEEID